MILSSSPKTKWHGLQILAISVSSFVIGELLSRESIHCPSLPTWLDHGRIVSSVRRSNIVENIPKDMPTVSVTASSNVVFMTSSCRRNVHISTSSWSPQAITCCTDTRFSMKGSQSLFMRVSASLVSHAPGLNPTAVMADQQG